MNTERIDENTKVRLPLIWIVLSLIFIVSTTVGATIWCTKVSNDINQLKSDVADIKNAVHLSSPKVASKE